MVSYLSRLATREATLRQYFLYHLMQHHFGWQSCEVTIFFLLSMKVPLEAKFRTLQSFKILWPRLKDRQNSFYCGQKFGFFCPPWFSVDSSRLLRFLRPCLCFQTYDFSPLLLFPFSCTVCLKNKPRLPITISNKSQNKK